MVLHPRRAFCPCSFKFAELSDFFVISETLIRHCKFFPKVDLCGFVGGH